MANGSGKGIGPNALFGYLIPLVFVGLAIADFLPDQKIDKYLIGGLMIFGLGALGYRVDTLIEKYLDSRGAGPPPPPPPQRRRKEAVVEEDEEDEG